jgi:putative MATE family efflux protein
MEQRVVNVKRDSAGTMDEKLHVDSAEKRTKFLGEGGIVELIRRMSFPVIASMAAVAVFQIIDAIFVGRLGTAALGAVSVSFPIFAVVSGLGQAFGTGAASWMSRYLGSGKKDEAGIVASTAVVSVGISGLILAGTILIIIDPLLRLLGATDTIIGFASLYTRILVLANVITMLNITMVNIIRAEGNAKYGMFSTLISAGLNILLDPILIFGFGLGMPGAAIATLIAQLCAFAFLVSSFVRGSNHCKISLRAGFGGIAHIGRILVAGAPIFFLQLLGASALGLINHVAMKYGDAAVAAVGLAFRILSVGMFPIYGFSTGFQPVAGYSYGAGDYDRVFRVIRTAVSWVFAFAVIFAAVVLTGAPQIVGAFSTDARVVDIGTRILRAVIILFPLFSLQIVMAVLFQALGYAVFAALIILSRQGIFFIPSILLLPRFFGLDGIIYSQPIADVLTSLLTVVFSIFVIRKLRREARATV